VAALLDCVRMGMRHARENISTSSSPTSVPACRGAVDRLFAMLYEDFRGQAHLLLRLGPRHTLCTTELVNETWLRLSGRSLPVADRVHFFNTAARAMRSCSSTARAIATRTSATAARR
jgi:hypothetical protein